MASWVALGPSGVGLGEFFQAFGCDHELEKRGQMTKNQSQRHTPMLVVFFGACRVFLTGLGHSWVALGPWGSWDGLGSVLGALGLSWWDLGGSGGVLGALLGDPGRPRGGG